MTPTKVTEGFDNVSFGDALKVSAENKTDKTQTYRCIKKGVVSEMEIGSGTVIVIPGMTCELVKEKEMRMDVVCVWVGIFFIAVGYFIRWSGMK